MEYRDQDINVIADRINAIDIVVAGEIIGMGNGELIHSAADPIDIRESYTGSGLPYPNCEVAFSHCLQCNKKVAVVNGKFKFILKLPSAYYLDQGKVLVGPEVRLQFNVNLKYVKVNYV